MKKITALLIICISILLFTSCNNTSNKGDSASFVFGEEITTTKFTFDPLALQTIVLQFIIILKVFLLVDIILLLKIFLSLLNTIVLTIL